jgi:hypothetical protein
MGSRRPPDPFTSIHAEAAIAASVLSREMQCEPFAGSRCSMETPSRSACRSAAPCYAPTANGSRTHGSYVGGVCGSNTVLALATVLGGEDPTPPEPTPSAAFAVT